MTFLCLSRIALSHFLNTLYSLMESISNLMASYHLLIFVFRVKLHGLHVVSGDEVSKHVSLGSPDLSDLTCLIALVRTLSFLARFLNLHHSSRASRSFSLAYAAQVTGSSAAMMERGSKVISPVSHST